VGENESVGPKLTEGVVRLPVQNTAPKLPVHGNRSNFSATRKVDYTCQGDFVSSVSFPQP